MDNIKPSTSSCEFNIDDIIDKILAVRTYNSYIN